MTALEIEGIRPANEDPGSVVLERAPSLADRAGRADEACARHSGFWRAGASKAEYLTDRFCVRFKTLTRRSLHRFKADTKVSARRQIYQRAINDLGTLDRSWSPQKPREFNPQTGQNLPVTSTITA